jgi:predicted nucleic acid-binding protein
MVEKYLIDTSIWIDMYEDRLGFKNEPIGEYASKFIFELFVREQIILISDILIMELGRYYSIEQISGMLKPFQNIIEKIMSTTDELNESKIISIARNVPSGDALHAILARNHNAILITRDNHFLRLEDISEHFAPEDLI